MRLTKHCNNTLQPTLFVAWLSISRRTPDESYRGVTASEGGLGTCKGRETKQLHCMLGVKMLCCELTVPFDDWQKII